MQGIIPLYQLAILHNTTTDLVSTAPGSQNTGGEKAAFYILQALPELVINAALVAINVRVMYNTGPWGDKNKDEPSTDEETTIQLREPEERAEVQDEFRELLAAVPRLAREYVLLDRLGTGTFSTVYKARDLLQDRYDNTQWKT